MIGVKIVEKLSNCCGYSISNYWKKISVRQTTFEMFLNIAKDDRPEIKSLHLIVKRLYQTIELIRGRDRSLSDNLKVN